MGDDVAALKSARHVLSSSSSSAAASMIPLTSVIVNVIEMMS